MLWHNLQAPSETLPMSVPQQKFSRININKIFNISCHGYLTLHANFSCFRCRLLSFSNYPFQTFRITIRVSDGLDPDQDFIVDPDLGPNCLQRLSADDKSHL